MEPSSRGGSSPTSQRFLLVPTWRGGACDGMPLRKGLPFLHRAARKIRLRYGVIQCREGRLIRGRARDGSLSISNERSVQEPLMLAALDAKEKAEICVLFFVVCRG